MEANGLFHALIFDSKGGAQEIDYDTLIAYTPKENEVLWAHFDYTSTQAQEYISQCKYIDSVIQDALLIEETRPRTVIYKDAVLLALRGVNLNLNAQPEDMVTIRAYLSKNIIISTKKRNLLSVYDIVDALRNGNGPCNVSQFLIMLTQRLIFRMEETIENSEENFSSIEEQLIESKKFDERIEILSIRKEVLTLRRYLFPQKEAMNRLFLEHVSWLSDYDRIQIREITDQLIRYIEELDSLKDRITLVQEEISNKLSEQMSRRMYVLSIISAIFLPLSFLTGLLGINVGGIPGANNNTAFFAVSALLFGIACLQYFVLKKSKWL